MLHLKMPSLNALKVCNGRQPGSRRTFHRSRSSLPPSKVDASLTVRQGQPGIQALIDSKNVTTEIEWRVRIALVISANDVNDEIKALDASIDTLDRFSNNLRRLRHLEEALPSQKATRLAKSLRTVRRYTADLHDGLSQCWKQSCHVHHEAKLFLDARLYNGHPEKTQRASSGLCCTASQQHNFLFGMRRLSMLRTTMMVRPMLAHQSTPKFLKSRL